MVPRHTSSAENAPIIIDQLNKFDKLLWDATARKSVRFVSVQWLVAQPERYVIEGRRELEKREARGETSIFLDPHAANLLIEGGSRQIAALSYGWASRGSPDPTRSRLRALKAFLTRSELRGRFVGLFWDCCSIYVPLPHAPRSPEEDESYRDATRVLGLLYASPLASCVVQMSFLPEEMPPEVAGRMTIGGLPSTISHEEVMQVRGACCATPHRLHRTECTGTVYTARCARERSARAQHTR